MNQSCECSRLRARGQARRLSYFVGTIHGLGAPTMLFVRASHGPAVAELRPADCQSAIQQATGLRYDGAVCSVHGADAQSNGFGNSP